MWEYIASLQEERRSPTGNLQRWNDKGVID